MSFSAAVIRELKKRSGGVCEGCGQAQATQAHHRQYRSRGGSDLISNAMHLCGTGNHTGCHGRAHTAAGEADGWSVRSGFDPAEVPMRIITAFIERWVRFDPITGFEDINQYDAIEYLFAIHAREETQDASN